MPSRYKLAGLAAIALLAGAAGPRTIGWSNTIILSASGNSVQGNPEAAVSLVEYVSYACGECARFQIQSDGVLQLAYLPSGRLNIEVRPVIESPIDLTAAMLASCGPKERSFLNHNALLRGQSNWIKPMAHASSVQRRRWSAPDLGTRNRAIAADFDFYAVMAARGYDRQSVERCLTDTAMAARITAQSDTATAAGVKSTPSFSINGKLLIGVHDWTGLRPQLDESLH